MIASGEEFLKNLNIELKNHPNKASVLADYELYIYDLTENLLETEEITYSILVEKLGTPKELAKMWRAELKVTGTKTKWIFVFSNISLFIGGIVLTWSYHVLGLEWINQLWNGLTTISFLIIAIYTLFWGLLGYEIGKEFGARGKVLLRRTFSIAIMPNLLLMFLVLFKFIPLEWFEPYASTSFIILCVGMTGVFYPISILGYKWGRKASV